MTTQPPTDAAREAASDPIQIVRDYQTVADAKYLSVKSRIDGGEVGLEMTLAVALGLSHQTREIYERLVATRQQPEAGREGEASLGGKRQAVIAAMEAYIDSAGVPLTEFDPAFAARMMAAMMVSFHKYGRVAQAYPVKFDAASDVRARMKKYRETGNKHFLVDAANFAMIEAMHPSRSDATWGSNDAADSPGRTTASGHRLVQEDNDGNRIMGETILHIPGEEA